MNPNTTEETGTANASNGPVRKSLLVGIAVALLIVVAGVIALSSRAKKDTQGPVEAPAAEQAQTPTTVPNSSASAEEPKAIQTPVTPAQVQRPASPAPVVAPAPSRSAQTVENAPPRVEPSPATRQMVESLTQLDLKQGPLTPEKAAEWKQNLRQLTSQGAAAIPAIREFLDKNLDLGYDAGTEGLLGQPSLRMSFLEALQSIGGSEAMAVSSQVLQTTLDPREIAWLAQSLEKQAPGQYAQAAADAARSALGMASTGQLEGRDVGPLFGVLQQYGGPAAAGELEKFSGQYRYYSTIALANLPDGAGIPSLIKMVQDPDAVSKGGRAPALQMLAQASMQSPDAFKVLVEQAQLGQIPSATWLNIASILSGDKVLIGAAPLESGVRSFHLSSGNQNYYTIPDRSPWPPEMVNAYVSKVDQLLAGNNNEVAKAALQNARASLQGRLQPAVATGGGGEGP